MLDSSHLLGSCVAFRANAKMLDLTAGEGLGIESKITVDVFVCVFHFSTGHCGEGVCDG